MISAKEARAASLLSSQKRMQVVREEAIPAILKQIEKCIEREIRMGECECRYFLDDIYNGIYVSRVDYSLIIGSVEVKLKEEGYKVSSCTFSDGLYFTIKW